MSDNNNNVNLIDNKLVESCFVKLLYYGENQLYHHLLSFIKGYKKAGILNDKQFLIFWQACSLFYMQPTEDNTKPLKLWHFLEIKNDALYLFPVLAASIQAFQIF